MFCRPSIINVSQKNILVNSLTIRDRRRYDDPGFLVSQYSYSGIFQIYFIAYTAFELHAVKFPSVGQPYFSGSDSLFCRAVHDDMTAPNRIFVGDIINLSFDLSVAGRIFQSGDEISFFDGAVDTRVDDCFCGNQVIPAVFGSCAGSQRDKIFFGSLGRLIIVLSSYGRIAGPQYQAFGGAFYRRETVAGTTDVLLFGIENSNSVLFRRSFGL